MHPCWHGATDTATVDVVQASRAPAVAMPIRLSGVPVEIVPAVRPGADAWLSDMAGLTVEPVARRPREEQVAGVFKLYSQLNTPPERESVGDDLDATLILALSDNIEVTHMRFIAAAMHDAAIDGAAAGQPVATQTKSSPAKPPSDLKPKDNEAEPPAPMKL